MTFSQSIKSVFSKYVTFSGRASRSEYWYFALFNFIIYAVIYCIAAATTPVDVTEAVSGNGYFYSCFAALPTWASCVLSIYGLVVLLPSLAVSVRRLHDIGNGGGWIFINLIPLIGAIWYLVYMILPSQLGDNRFGPQPE
ncbi:MAG: DUF805 domain-containing protein [Lachnoclostridium sp.]|nr:DUF805 domain-containing protein [Lachnoclostridium sp.]